VASVAVALVAATVVLTLVLAATLVVALVLALSATVVLALAAALVALALLALTALALLAGLRGLVLLVLLILLILLALAAAGVVGVVGRLVGVAEQAAETGGRVLSGDLLGLVDDVVAVLADRVLCGALDAVEHSHDVSPEIDGWFPTTVGQRTRGGQGRRMNVRCEMPIAVTTAGSGVPPRP